MKICLLSDTHNFHQQITADIPRVDMLIHAGDFSSRGEDHEVELFIGWLASLTEIKHKIFICGNHELGVEKDRTTLVRTLKAVEGCGIHYLENTSVTIDGLKIWGSPATPRFYDWAWNYDENIREIWEKIPEHTDIVVTHGPMLRLGDFVERGEHVGCPHLRTKLEKVRPRLHVCGHIHRGYGQYQYGAGGTSLYPDLISVNASNLNERYAYVNKPIIVEIF